MSGDPRLPRTLVAGTLALVVGCGDGAEGAPPATGGSGGTSAGTPTGTSDGGDAGWAWGLPPGVPAPKTPDDNPMTAEKVELGRHLFYDPRLSLNETQSCASCHHQELAFTDDDAVSTGSTGDLTPRSSMSLVNVAYLATFTWANPSLVTLEAQALIPMFGEDPVELGLAGQEQELFARLAEDPIYIDLFSAAYPEEADPISLAGVTHAIACFERTLLSFDSPYDRYAYGGDPTALSDTAKRGRDLFFSEELECFHCHGGFNFSDSLTHDGKAITETMFHNTGLYNIGGSGAYPPGNGGVYELTGLASDMGRFRAPTLRNIALTAPYMHDGSVATLDDVIDHYAAGGRTVESGPFAGVGSENPNKSEFVTGFTLSEQERADLIAFLESLTDETFITDDTFSDPWEVR